MLPANPIDGLNAEQTREYYRAQALSNCFIEQSKVYTLYPPFEAVVKLFFDNNKKLIALCPGKDSNGTTITQGKDSLKAAVALDASIICTRTTAYAIATGNKELQAAVYHSLSSIQKLKDADVLSFTTRLTGAVSPLLSESAFMPYSVTAEMLSLLSDKAVRFNSTIGKATYADSKKSFYSASINEVLKAIRDNVIQFDLLLNFFEKEHPEFVKEYRKAAVIDYSNIRHSGIEGKVINPLTGAAIEGATITGEGKKKIANTNKDGIYRLIKLKITTMKITITAPGYEPQVVDVKIIRGKVQQLNIELKGKLITLAATA